MPTSDILDRIAAPVGLIGTFGGLLILLWFGFAQDLEVDLSALPAGTTVHEPAGPVQVALPNDAELRTWIDGFKAAPRGPFERIRWFCKDGSVLPPKAYACKNHGGGIQHGEWNQRAKTLRAGGYTVANVLASLDTKAFVGSKADLWALEQILIERF